MFKIQTTNKGLEVIKKLLNFQDKEGTDKSFGIKKLQISNSKKYPQGIKTESIITKKFIYEIGWVKKASFLKKFDKRLNEGLIPELIKQKIIIEDRFEYKYNNQKSGFAIIKLNDEKNIFLSIMLNSIEDDYFDEFITSDYYFRSKNRLPIAREYEQVIFKNEWLKSIRETYERAQPRYLERNFEESEHKILIYPYLFYQYHQDKMNFNSTIEETFKIFSKNIRIDDEELKRSRFAKFFFSSLSLLRIMDQISKGYSTNPLLEKIYSESFNSFTDSIDNSAVLKYHKLIMKLLNNNNPELANQVKNAIKEESDKEKKAIEMKIKKANGGKP